MLLHVQGRAEARPSVRAARESAQRHQSPVQLSIGGNFQVRDARRCTAIWSRDASRVEKEDSFPPFVPRYVCMAVENNVDIFRRAFRRNVHEAKPHAVSFQVGNEGPFEIAVAVSAHNRHWQPDIFEGLQNGRGTDIAEMPYFIRTGRQRIDFGGQMIVGVGQDEDFHRAGGSAAPRAMPNKCGFAA
jgi:hypothetical protein